MTALPTWLHRPWWLVSLAVLCTLVFIDWRRIERVRHVTGLEAEALSTDSSSPTGYAGGVRQLVVPERNVESYQWIAQTQQALADKTLRLRRTTLDNWPEGRDVRTPSPYRWYLSVLARIHHAATALPLGQSVEWAAVFAGPVLRFLSLLVLLAFTARHFGVLAAALFALGWLGCFPFSVTFLAGQPDAADLARVLALLALLALVAAAAKPDPQPDSKPVRRLFVLSAVAGGVGLWLSVQHLAPVLLGVSPARG